MDMRERVLLRMKELDINTSQLAKKVGKRQGVLWSLVSGRTKTFRDIPSLADALQTTPQWLLTGHDGAKQRDTIKNGELVEAVLKQALENGEPPGKKLIQLALNDLQHLMEKVRQNDR